MDNFDLKKYLVENKVTTNSQMINEAEGEAPLTITVEVTAKGRSSMRLYTGPSSIKMTGGNNSDYYYIGNTKAELGKETNIYFATYRDDIKEIQTMYLALIPGNGKFNELVNSKYLNSNEIENLPSDIRKVPDAYFAFQNGFGVGEEDHRGYFRILQIG